FSFPHHRHTPHFRRQLSPHEQTEILSDLQQNHRFNQQQIINQRPSANLRHQQFTNFQQQQQQQRQVPPQQPFLNQQAHVTNQQQRFQQTPPLSTQQSLDRFPQPQSPHATQQSPVLLSLQQSPLSSPQFSSLFTAQQSQAQFSQPQSPFSTQNSQVISQISPVQLSLQNSPLSNLQSQGVFSQSPLGIPQSPVSTQQSPPRINVQLSSGLIPIQQSSLTTQQSSEIISQQPVSPFSTQQSVPSTQQSVLTSQKSLINQQGSKLSKSEPKTEDLNVKVLKGVSNTEFTIEKSVSDPEELQKVQEIELKREKERRERVLKLQQEQLKLLQEENARRLKERQEEDRRDEERRLKFLEDLKRIEEAKAKRLKEQEEERRRLIQEEKERQQKREEEERQRQLKEEKERLLKQQQETERLRKLEEENERKEKEEKLRKLKEQEVRQQQEQQSTNPGVIYAQPTQITGTSDGISTLQPLFFGEKQLPTLSTTTILQEKAQDNKESKIISQELKRSRSRQRARLIDDAPDAEGLFLQNERQKLYYQLKEAQQQQQSKENDERQQPQESQQVANNQGPINQVVQNKQTQRRTQQSKITQLEKQVQQKQLQDQLQNQFQAQLLQRQDLLRQLKLAVSNAATPTNEDQIVPGPITVSAGNSSAPLFLANGQKIQIVQSPRQGRPAEISPRNLQFSASSTTTQRPPRALFEELTKGVLPPGADFEVIRHKQDGGLEGVGKQLPQNLPQKKVTFVFLEEQSDGSFKVKGVRGNNNGQPEGEQPQVADVDSIIKKIQEGDLKLPPTTKVTHLPQTTVPQHPTSLPPTTVARQYVQQSSTINTYPTTPKPRPNSIIKTVSTNLNFQSHPEMEIFSSVTLPPLYNVDASVNTDASEKTTVNKQTTQSDFPTTLSHSPYSVEVHPGGQNSQSSVFPQVGSSPQTPQSPGSSNPYLPQIPEQQVPSQQYHQNNLNQVYQQQINPVTPYPTVHEFSPTPNSITTNFSPNKYSPSLVTQYATSAPKSVPKEHFLPTNPSFINSPPISQQSYIEEDVPVPGVIYANPSSTSTLTTKPTPTRSNPDADYQSAYNKKQPKYQQNEEAPSLKSPTRVAAPNNLNTLKEGIKLSPLDEDGSVDHLTKVEAPQSLAQVLKKEGLYAMARFLRESGLNNILNDTGPYTVFAPTDKAFRALLVQLGGPEKAEEKFKENPRLLSGLLLHHVIPGAFELSSLQDEMTGVSLAGTQLRVNAYNSQDAEWNDVQVVTINGARISRDKHNIPIPQGIAHAVERVMFPLPVGNILQTLRSDRERRFNKFLRAIQASGLTDSFSGNKVYTVFAPVDKAFSVVDSDDLERLLTDRDMARQVKANTANVVTHNIPATNGVIHAIEGLL
ncbi:hypothetical protein C0J52_19187, partial [Blattella germanica]